MTLQIFLIGAVTGVLATCAWILLRPKPGPKASKRALRSLESRDSGDPIADAETRMAYGWYEDAAELLSRAIARDGHRVDLKVKLLQVYFVWGNADQIATTASLFQSALEAAGEWDKVRMMGKTIGQSL